MKTKKSGIAAQRFCAPSANGKLCRCIHLGICEEKDNVRKTNTVISNASICHRSLFVENHCDAANRLLARLRRRCEDHPNPFVDLTRADVMTHHH